MIFTETRLKGAYIIEPERMEDERGFFALSWSEREFKAHGLDARLLECNISFNMRRGTLRGMHYQVAPHAQAKLVRCTRGAIYDVAVDLRPESETFKQWVAVELSARNCLQFYIPAGLAHGFQTLEDETEISYQMSEVYAPKCAGGVRWNDTAFSIEWPEMERIITDRDAQYPDFIG
ncbi:MAG: dTDP-4-dehydrorhamnose 3,5-epimerase [Acidobacteria bacterium 13_1_20CM_3_53_8]|nr:MAG: dTDP-4-dehydrorhamnose 3,5-epimerase [Acidobacteria bacterium 13_1_20CM_3_53_8]